MWTFRAPHNTLTSGQLCHVATGLHECEITCPWPGRHLLSTLHSLLLLLMLMFMLLVPLMHCCGLRLTNPLVTTWRECKWWGEKKWVGWIKWNIIEAKKTFKITASQIGKAQCVRKLVERPLLKCICFFLLSSSFSLAHFYFYQANISQARGSDSENSERDATCDYLPEELSSHQPPSHETSERGENSWLATFNLSTIDRRLRDDSISVRSITLPTAAAAARLVHSLVYMQGCTINHAA